MIDSNKAIKSRTLAKIISIFIATHFLIANTYVHADEAPAAVEGVIGGPRDATNPVETSEVEPPWDLSFTLNFVSDYRARGISQTWLAPAV